MASQTKAATAANLDLTALVDGQQADASDVTIPLNQAAMAVDRARSMLSVTDNDTHIKPLTDALTVGSGITKSVVNPSGDEQLQLAIDTAIVATLTAAQTLSNKTLTTPTISGTGFANMNHAHTGSTSGGQLNASSVFNTGTVPVARLPVMGAASAGAGGAAGLAPASAAGDQNKVLKANATWSLIDLSTMISAALLPVANLPILVGTDGVSPGTAGAVPAPVALDAGKYLRADGTWQPVAGAGTVTSVGLSLPSDLLTVSGSPVTAAGTLTGSKPTTTANRVYASPNGSNGQATFRALVEADIPTLTNAKISDRALTELNSFAQLGVGGAATIDINPVASGYNHLLLIVALRTNHTNTADTVLLRFNNDAVAGNYYALGQRIIHSAALVTNEALATVGGIRMHSAAAATNSAANLFGFITIWIHNYLMTGFSGTYRAIAKYEGFVPGVNTGEPVTTQGGGHYLAAGAINRITLLPLNGTIFEQYSSYALYGVG